MSKPQTALAKTPATEIIAIKVNFTLNSKEGLRRVLFGLQKDTEGEVVSWTIHFELFEREKKSASFGDALVTLNVELDSKLNSKAEAAAKNGLTPGQAAHAIGPAAADAKALRAGEINAADASETVAATLRKK